MIVQGTVQRLVMNDGHPYMEYRTRDLGAMFVETEWGWSREADDAYIFPEFGAAALPSHAYATHATSHAETLIAQGARHVHPVVHGSEARAARELRRARRDASLDATVREMSVTPAEAYERTRRLLGERD